ncbi:Uma2 family endonuclease [Streptomyces sp. MNU76]|uniref:Uma2 family endonuclease n=1 Tax=Streptomyces sp. MNU76 TaxID=2560026 RepID=UPI001E3FA48B|nr:Uma2 family endonuclease [Streptomyces sp. MNU76]MCC9706847.1 Uma2 family endonuclease [Streptomyces sp. MNU76]
MRPQRDARQPGGVRPGDGNGPDRLTSPPQDRDRETKILGHARAGIPVYLLIDREEAEVTVFSEPSADRYAKAVKCKLGLVVPLPGPLGFDLDTAEF